MRRIFQKELDMILHWNLTLVGGFLGTYAILLHAGNFGSAQTGNVMEMAAALTGKNFAEVGIRFLAFLIFGSAIVISYLLTNFTKLDMRKLVTTEIYTLSLHDALPIWDVCGCEPLPDIFLFGISVGQLFRRIGV